MAAAPKFPLSGVEHHPLLLQASPRLTYDEPGGLGSTAHYLPLPRLLAVLNETQRSERL